MFKGSTGEHRDTACSALGDGDEGNAPGRCSVKSISGAAQAKLHAQ